VIRRRRSRPRSSTTSTTNTAHSGIGYNTPANVHYGLADIVRQKRQGVLDAACANRPDRFTKPPQAPTVPQATWINRPEEEPATI
jgi:putative transposase